MEYEFCFTDSYRILEENMYSLYQYFSLSLSIYKFVNWLFLLESV